jgi:ribosomal protein S18 acetylase RimI-like enzyme
MASLRQIFSSALSAVQSLRLYRQVARRWYGRYRVIVASPQDMDAIARWLELDDRQKKERCEPGVTCLVAKSGKMILGYVELYRRPSDHPLYPGYWLCSLLIKPVFRGLGVGEALTCEVINRSTAENALGVYLVVRTENNRAIALYQKLGFEFIELPGLQAELEHERLADGFSRTSMVKWLGYRG